MSTVGRIGWMRALTKVLTRSRGTPAAAFAMYCSRNVLVDTGLPVLYTKGTKDRSFVPFASFVSFLLREGRPGVRTDIHVLVDAPGQRRIEQPRAARRRSQIQEVRIGTVGMRAGPDRGVVDGRTGLAVRLHQQTRAAGLPREAPEVPA